MKKDTKIILAMDEDNCEVESIIIDVNFRKKIIYVKEWYSEYDSFHFKMNPESYSKLESLKEKVKEVIEKQHPDLNTFELRLKDRKY